MDNSKHRIHARLHPDQYTWLQRRASKLGIPASEIIRRLIQAEMDFNNK